MKFLDYQTFNLLSTPGLLKHTVAMEISTHQALLALLPLTTVLWSPWLPPVAAQKWRYQGIGQGNVQGDAGPRAGGEGADPRFVDYPGELATFFFCKCLFSCVVLFCLCVS